MAASTRRRSIFYYPDRPIPSQMLERIRTFAGWNLAESPGDADWRIFFRDATTISLPDEDPWADVSAGWINGRCRDISKRMVERTFASIFGYPLAIDPRSCQGNYLRKNNKNFVKDAVVLTCPASPGELDDTYVYERLVDCCVPDLGCVELRTNVVGGDVVSVTKKIRPDWVSKGRVTTAKLDQSFVNPRSVYTQHELERISAFCGAMNLDFGALDIMRDRTDGRIYILDANNTPNFDDGLWWEELELVLVARAFVKHFPPRSSGLDRTGSGVRSHPGTQEVTPKGSIYFYPHQPASFHMVDFLRQRSGWDLAKHPEMADWCVFHQDSTTISLPVNDPWGEASTGWINGRCRDISKRAVERTFQAVFGYPLAVDPLTHQGVCLRKSNLNCVKDAVVLSCPIPPGSLDDQYAYERLIDSTVPGLGTRELRAYVVGGDVISVRRRIRRDWLNTTGRLDTTTLDDTIVVPASVFSPQEMEQISTFCLAMGLDFGALDIIRDKNDERIYIVDVNNTPSYDLDRVWALGALDQIARAFTEHFPSRFELPEPPTAPTDMTRPVEWSGPANSRGWGSSISAQVVRQTERIERLEAHMDDVRAGIALLLAAHGDRLRRPRKKKRRT